GEVFTIAGDPGRGFPGSWTSVSQGTSLPGSLITAVPFGQRFAVFLTDPNGGVYTAAGTPGTPFGQWAIVGDPFRAKPGSPVTAVPWGDRFALFTTNGNGEGLPHAILCGVTISRFFSFAIKPDGGSASAVAHRGGARSAFAPHPLRSKPGPQ